MALHLGLDPVTARTLSTDISTHLRARVLVSLRQRSLPSFIASALSYSTVSSAPKHDTRKSREFAQVTAGGAKSSAKQARHFGPRKQGNDLAKASGLFVALESKAVTASNLIAYPEALRAGLKALRVLGVSGITVEIYWGVVEAGEPGVYDWSAYKLMLRMIRDLGFLVKVSLCFHSSEGLPLPQWVLEQGHRNPDVFFTDKAGAVSTECLSLGVDEVPVVAGRSAVGIYTGLMESFQEEFGSWFGTTITECTIGLGPNGELQYPSHSSDRRFQFPGIGEFQCYDKFMLASLRACAEQVGQPSWGLSGPHDAGSYCMWPHQTGFFHHNGSWSSAYGRFFLQWYSEMLVRHADRVVGGANKVFEGLPLHLSVRIPGYHWWYNTASHAPELTAGYYNTAMRDGYLPAFQVLSHHGVGVHLGLAEQRNHEQLPQAFCDPEKLLLQQRTVAAALGLPVTLENRSRRLDSSALSKMEACSFGAVVSQGIDLPPVAGLTVQHMTDAMFEPSNWISFKAFVRSVQQHADTAAAASSSAAALGSIDLPAPSTSAAPSVGRPVFA